MMRNVLEKKEIKTWMCVDIWWKYCTAGVRPTTSSVDYITHPLFRISVLFKNKNRQLPTVARTHWLIWAWRRRAGFWGVFLSRYILQSKGFLAYDNSNSRHFRAPTAPATLQLCRTSVSNLRHSRFPQKKCGCPVSRPPAANLLWSKAESVQ